MPTRWLRTPPGLSILTILVLLCVTAVLAALGLVASLSSRDPVWDPFGDFPPQDVTSRVDGVDGPAAPLSGTVDVAATKCYVAATEVIGSITWRPVDRPEAQVQTVTQAAGGRDAPGCYALELANPIPGAVAELVRGGLDRWQITGIEQAIDQHGNPGAVQTWETHVFVIVDDGGTPDE